MNRKKKTKKEYKVYRKDMSEKLLCKVIGYALQGREMPGSNPIIDIAILATHSPCIFSLSTQYVYFNDIQIRDAFIHKDFFSYKYYMTLNTWLSG